MILFTILTIIAIVLGVVAIVIFGVGGIALLITFGDIIVCIAIITLIARHIFRRIRRR